MHSVFTPAHLGDEHRARRIPRRVAARFPRRAQSARREARCIGLALNELRCAERFHRLPVVERQERVVLLGGQSGLRLEPVREVRRTALDRPLFDRLRDARRDVEVELFAVTNRVDELRVRFARQLVAHLSHAKRVDPEILGGALGCGFAVHVGWGVDFTLGDFAQNRLAGRYG